MVVLAGERSTLELVNVILPVLGDQSALHPLVFRSPPITQVPFRPV
jgi:hypothetical protein